MFLSSENLNLDLGVGPAACDFVSAEIALYERMGRAQFLRLIVLATDRYYRQFFSWWEGKNKQVESHERHWISDRKETEYATVKKTQRDSG